MPENYKDLISFIVNGDTLSTKDETNIKINQKNFQIEIYFSSYIATIEKFLSGMSDMLSVDFSNFYSSNLTYVKEIFKGSTSLISMKR